MSNRPPPRLGRIERNLKFTIVANNTTPRELTTVQYSFCVADLVKAGLINGETARHARFLDAPTRSQLDHRSESRSSLDPTPQCVYERQKRTKRR